MKVLFRVDASLSIGTGHIMRCRTLAAALKKKGICPHFVTRAHQGNLADLLIRDGFRVSLLTAPASNQSLGGMYANWLGVSQNQDAAETIEQLDEHLYEYLIVDHYGLDFIWEKRLRQFAKKMVVIDDLGNRHHECDILLDQNFSLNYNSRYRKLAPENCQFLLGPQYAILGSEYNQSCRQDKVRHGEVKRVLVFMGGSDNLNITSVILNALKKKRLDHLIVDIVLGVNYIHKNTVAQHASERLNTNIYGPCESLVSLMQDADLAIGAGGITLWERMSLGLPSLVVAIADNQRPACEALSEAGFIWYLGCANDVNENSIEDAILDAISDPNYLMTLANKSKNLVDGNGVNRVLDAVCSRP